MMMVMQAPVMQQFVDRITPQGGATSLQQPSVIQIAYNAEVRQASCCRHFQYCLTCRCYNHSRSYLYLRENSIETNEGADHMCRSLCRALLEVVACPIQCAYDFCCCIAPGCSVVSQVRKLIPCCRENSDSVNVVYFDRDYLEASTEGCCCVQENTPKLEVLEHGCMVCCIRCPPLMNLLCGCFAETCDLPTKSVIIMPYESRKCCWCCDYPNRVDGCQNCCGLCGKLTGSPITYDSFYPQPKNVEAFVTVAQPLVASRQGAGATLPLSAFVFQAPAGQAFVHAAPVQAPPQYVYPPAPNAQPHAAAYDDDQHGRDVEMQKLWQTGQEELAAAEAVAAAVAAAKAAKEEEVVAAAAKSAEEEAAAAAATAEEEAAAAEARAAEERVANLTPTYTGVSLVKSTGR
jgi:hypothetical protein